MRKRISAILLAAVLLVSLSACAQTKSTVLDVSVSETGDVSASITPKKDMGEVAVHVTAKDDEDKVNFEGDMPLSESFAKNEKTQFSFNIFDTRLWAGATMSYNPFDNMYESFLKDQVTCSLMADGEEISSFDIDTSKIDAAKALETIVSQGGEEEDPAQTQEETSAEQTQIEEESPAEDDSADAPAETEEEKFFESEGYTIYYETVPQDKVEEVVGDLAQYIDTEGVDMEKNRLFYIHYTMAEKDGEEVMMGTAWRDISWGGLVFTVDGVDYRQGSVLMSSRTQTFITYLFVPAETPDDAPVSIR